MALHRPRFRVTALAASAAAGLLAPGAFACGGDDAFAASIRIVTSGEDGEYTFTIPAQVPEGATQLTLVNGGAESHHAQIFALDEGRSVADLGEALSTGDPAAALEVGTFVGGTGLVGPGTTSRADAILDLAPGEYVVICFVPDEEGVPHVAHGMMKQFEVVADDNPDTPPSADVEVVLSDYAFDLPDTIASDAVLAVTNAADTEAHEIVFLDPDDGANTADVAAALDADTEPPATGVGGMQALLPGSTEMLQLDLEPGEYIVVCAVTSPDGTPHYHHGMINVVTVT